MASNAPNAPTIHATAPETRPGSRRRPPSTSLRALASSRHPVTTPSSSSATLIAYSGQTDLWGNDQGPQDFDTITYTASESMLGPVRPMQSPFTAGETLSQETALMQMGTRFEPHTNTEQRFPTSTLLPELDELNESQQYPLIPSYHVTPPSPTTTYSNYDWDPSPLF